MQFIKKVLKVLMLIKDLGLTKIETLQNYT